MKRQSMTLKRYLFALIAVLITLTAILQVGLVYYGNNLLQSEVEKRSRELSHQLVEFAFDRVDVPDVKWQTQTQTRTPLTSQEVRQLLRDNHWRYADDDNLVMVNPDSADVIQVVKVDNEGKAIGTIIVPRPNHIPAAELEQLRDALHSSIGKIGSVEVSEGNSTHYIFDSRSGDSQFLSLDTFQHNPTQNLMRVAGASIAVATLVALILAYWLSHHFSRPIARLTQGFEQLSQGQFGTQLDTKAIGELNTALGRFNAMSTQLNTYRDTEKQYLEQRHLAELGEVSRGLAHALRNPIHTIGLTAEQLAQEQLPATQRQQFVNTIQAKIQHIDKTIRALLTLTTPSANAITTVNLGHVITDIQLELSATNTDKVHYQIDCDNVLIQGNDNELRTILHAVIVNAVEASPSDGCVTIEAQARQDTENNERILITVTDQGDGIPQSIRSKLFQPHITTKAEGSGMGLYISKRLAELHYRGQITLEDAETGGTKVTLNLAGERI